MRMSGIGMFRVARRLAGAVATLALLLPLPATAQQPAAQQANDWEVSVAPFYLWVANIDGQMGVLGRTVPVSMDFDAAADHLSAAFTIHFEARKGRWGVFTDVNFIQLSTSSEFTFDVAGTTLTVGGDLELDQTVFEIGGSYLVSRPATFAIIGGLRTYTMAPKASFTGALAPLEPIDVSQTSANAFGGFTYRPQLGRRWTFGARADIGGGDAKLTWSGVAGFEWAFKPWGRIGFGYKALYIDTGDVGDVITEYDVTTYGPMVGLNFVWGARPPSP